MLASWPGVTAPGSKTDHPVIIEDFFSTILEIAGIQNPEQVGGVIDGISFTDVLRGHSDRPVSQRALHWHFPNHWGPKGPGIGPSSAIRRGDWKLIHYYDGRPTELFNIAADLGESNNLATQNPEITQKLTHELRKFLMDAGAQFPLDKNTGEQKTMQLHQQ